MSMHQPSSTFTPRETLSSSAEEELKAKVRKALKGVLDIDFEGDVNVQIGSQGAKVEISQVPNEVKGEVFEAVQRVLGKNLQVTFEGASGEESEGDSETEVNEELGDNDDSETEANEELRDNRRTEAMEVAIREVVKGDAPEGMDPEEWARTKSVGS